MSRNTDSHFGLAPMKNIRRSAFKRPCTYSTTGNTGEIIPFLVDEVLPGDTVKMHTASLVRMLTPIAPVMDNAWMDTYFFFVPRRLLWEHWKEFMGENTNDAWTQEGEYQIPQLTTPKDGWNKGTLGEKLYGIQGREGSVDACYARGYTLIFNEWFRSENLTEPAEVSLGDSTTTGTNGDDYVVDMQKGGCLAKAVKYADYFTRALPQPQKGPDIYLPLGTSAPILGNGSITGNAQISGTGKTIGLEYEYDNALWGMGLTSYNGTLTGRDDLYTKARGTVSQEAFPTNITPLSGLALTSAPNESGMIANTNELPVSLASAYADLTNATAATINQLRQAFAIQRMYEIDARGGTRYTEILRAHFGVTSPDGRQQRPEYLGGKRIPINISQVVQQSSTDATSPQGNTAAYSLTIDNHDDFTKSFDEHGILYGLCVIRTEHTYQQGIDRKFSRKNRSDFYFPALANIGEQYIKNKEIFAGTEDDEDAFGYQEAWAEYRYANNHVTGELNSDYANSLDIWTFADDFEELPVLGDEFIRETDANVQRTLAIQNQDQWRFNFYLDQTWVRPMPIYSIPQLAGWM